MAVKISGGVEVNILDHVWYFEGSQPKEGVLKAVFPSTFSATEQLYVGDKLYSTYEVFPDKLAALTARRVRLLAEESQAEQQLRRSREQLQLIQKQIREI